MGIKKYFFSLLVLIPLLGQAAVTEVTIYSDDSYSPYSYSDKNGKAVGIYTQIIKEAFKLMPEYKLKIIPLPWKRAMISLEKKEVIAVYPPYYRPSERPFIGEYSEPLLTENIIVVARKDRENYKLKSWPKDWLDKKIGIFLGTIDIAGPEFTKAYHDKKVSIVETKGNEENLFKLGSGEIDAYVNDRIAIFHTLKNLKRKNMWPKNFSEIEEVAIVSAEQGYLAFANPDPKFPYQKDLILKFNKAIEKMKKENRIKAIVDQSL
ncbi:transporter substrate-binding domain-containing protein [Bacteriovorax sp. PP10]|uniref:Transporter substrate-binding domain-containing protein n=1 Tax=Bacteriovorax antarcticus TaxID=3088717 RepID=A0ABU5VRE0_9BACT|nr:transporter substrate-binding domain-containing protein [Bacteriovorax sp. PP10]MEA9355615.1 transporter substrate-binding domain-containing protein [Bacteriovorax sp. PP10]